MRKVAVITGGAVRVGRAVALHLVRHGYDLLVTYRSSEAAARSLESQCAADGGRCVLLRCDLRDRDAAVRIGDAHRRHFGERLNLLVHNASVFPAATLEATTREMMQELLDVHVLAPQLITAELAGRLRASRGCVVAMTDGVEGRGYLRYSAYAASKAALSSLVRSWALALAPEARANAIAPGVVAWPQDMPEEERASYLARVPLGRTGTPDDIAHAVLFLAEEAAYVTGIVLAVDGGRR